MDLFELFAALVTLAALFSYINYRWVRLPNTIGLMLIALLFSLSLIGIGWFVPRVEQTADSIVASVDFSQTLMHGMLGFLLFAGALHINLNELAEHRWLIASLATIGVLISVVLVGAMAWTVLQLIGLEIPLIWCLLFGAVISPTDPIAVLGIMKQSGAPRNLEIKVAGESLFNDGVGVVVFLGLLEIATGEYGFDVAHLSGLFLQEAVGGAALGLGIGYAAFRMLRTVDSYPVEILISLAVTAGGYALASAWHLSGPIAMVVAGLFIGNHGRKLAMSPATCRRLDDFWELIDEILNAILFVLIGLEVLILSFTGQYLITGLLMIPVVLLARWISVGLPLNALRQWRSIHPQAIRILTWGGLRGGISVALALSIPGRMHDGSPIGAREPILAMTYIVVVFSILAQGLTIGRVVRSILRHTDRQDPAEQATAPP